MTNYQGWGVRRRLRLARRSQSSSSVCTAMALSLLSDWRSRGILQLFEICLFFRVRTSPLRAKVSSRHSVQLLGDQKPWLSDSARKTPQPLGETLKVIGNGSMWHTWALMMVPGGISLSREMRSTYRIDRQGFLKRGYHYLDVD